MMLKWSNGVVPPTKATTITILVVVHVVLIASPAASASMRSSPPIALPGCPHLCGNISVYPLPLWDRPWLLPQLLVQRHLQLHFGVPPKSQPTDAVDRIVYELRILAKRDSDCRGIIGGSGAISHLVKYLGSEDPSLQVNAVTTILNLSILHENKVRIMETDGAVNGVIEVLRTGATWEAKGNAAMAVYKKKLGRKTRVIRGLFDLARVGPSGSKKDALVAILSLAGDREAVGKMVECGAVEVMKEMVEDLPEEAVAALELVVKRGGVVSVTAAVEEGMVGQLTGMLRSGTGRTRESAASTLVIMCRRGGSDVVAELARTSGIEMAIWDLMGNGSSRAKRKAASLMRSIQRWAAGLEVDAASVVVPAVDVGSSVTVALP